MAVQFHPLPTEVFDEKARPYIARLNRELRDVFGLEGTIRNPIATRRSDDTIVRRGEVQVDVSRITPSISTVVSGSSTVVGTPALTFGLTNTVGTTTTALSVDSAIALFGTAVPADLAVASATGSSAFSARGDHVHAYPEAIATSLDRTKRGILTDDATYGALLDFAAGGAFTANFLALRAPGGAGDQSFRIGSDASIGVGGTPATATALITAVRAPAPYNSASIVSGIIGTVTQNGTGGCTALSFNALDSPTSASTGAVSGINITASHSNANSTGTLRGLNITLTALVGTASIGDIHGVRVAPSSFLNKTFTNYAGFEANDVTSGTITNHRSFYSSNLRTGGTLRAAFDSVGASSGSPTSVYNFRGTAHSVGSSRFGIWTDNQHYCDDSDFVCGTAAKGLVTKDTQGTPRFWRMYNTSGNTGSVGLTFVQTAKGHVYCQRGAGPTGDVHLKIDDAGTTAPAS